MSDLWFEGILTGLALVALAGIFVGIVYLDRHPAKTLSLVDSIVVIEGCEYLKFNGYHEFSYTHKGNCTNIIHGR